MAEISAMFNTKILSYPNNTWHQHQKDQSTEIMAELREKFKILSPHSSSNLFQAILYNKTNSPESRCPIHADVQKWREAVHNNPDPQKFSNVHVDGFETLKERAKIQNIFKKLYILRLETLESTISKLETTLNKNQLSIALKSLEQMDTLFARLATCLARKENLDAQYRVKATFTESSFAEGVQRFEGLIMKCVFMDKMADKIEAACNEKDVKKAVFDEIEEKDSISGKKCEKNEEIGLVLQKLQNAQKELAKIEKSLDRSSAKLEMAYSKLLDNK